MEEKRFWNGIFLSKLEDILHLAQFVWTVMYVSNLELVIVFPFLCIKRFFTQVTRSYSLC